MASKTKPKHGRLNSDKHNSEEAGHFDHDDLATETGQATSILPRPPQLNISHLLVISLGVLLYGLRVYNTSLLGYKIGLLGGTVPIECMLWSFTIIELALRDIWRLWQQMRATIAE